MPSALESESHYRRQSPLFAQDRPCLTAHTLSSEESVARRSLRTPLLLGSMRPLDLLKKSQPDFTAGPLDNRGDDWNSQYNIETDSGTSQAVFEPPKKGLGGCHKPAIYTPPRPTFLRYTPNTNARLFRVHTRNSAIFHASP